MSEKDKDINWVIVYTSEMPYQADLIKQKLEENDIPVVTVDKRDSAYVMIGHTEVHVPNDFAMRARTIITQHKNTPIED